MNAREPATSNRSLWLDTAPPTDFPPLEGECFADVAVIGGGITGLTTALLLAREGCSVVVAEARRIGAGATGNTSAKITSQHGLKYASLIERHGEQTARIFAAAHESAIEEIAALVADGIECDYRIRPAFVYAGSDQEREQVEREARAAATLGLPAAYVDRIPAPVHAAGAVRFENQAELHPQLYIIGLARRLVEAGGAVFEQTRAVDVSEGTPCIVRTERGTLQAGCVVIATLAPILDRGLFFAREFAQRSYVIAAPLEDAVPEGMFISAGEPIRSFRSHRINGGEHLVVGGESHPTGSADAREDRFVRLEEFAREHWDVQAVTHRWSAQDFAPADQLPFVGPINPWASSIYVATGFSKWGLTSGTLAAMLIRDAICGRENPWAKPLTATRLGVRSGLSRMLAENGRAGLTLLADGADALLRRSGPGPGDLDPDEGGIVASPAGKIAAYRDPAGVLHAVSRRCTHLGCPLSWNAAERTWDCPCHGSRFGIDGDVLEGPAVRPLARRRPGG